MHRIVLSHLQSFSKEHGVDGESESLQLEKFANFAILASKISAGFDVDEVTTSCDDDGIDGIALIVNEEHVISDSDANLIFSHERRNNDVELAFIQAKTSESYNLGDFLKFKEAILRFVNQEPYSVSCDILLDARAAFEIAIKNVPKIRNGKPNISVSYVTTGVYNNPEALESAKRDMIAQLEGLGLFQKIEIRFVGRDELISSWVASYSGIEASLNMHSSASLPQIAGIQEAYLVVARAKDYVDNLLTNKDGTIRVQLFEENVRHFLGQENPVNSEIEETINDTIRRSRFPVLNNGVTIVSPDVRVQGTLLYLSNYQIVNGCQTSHVIYLNRDKLADDIMLSIKVVETTDEDVFSELVRATNSQSEIEDSQFFSLSPLAKSIESYFNTYEGQDGRLYFERRDKQYVGRGIPAIRIVSLHNAAKSACAMFLRRPDLSFKYPKRMYEDLSDQIFAKGNKESIFYASSLALYRFHLLTSNNVIPHNMRRFKWHVLPLVATIISGKDVPKLNSRKMETYAQKIIDVLSHHSDEATEALSKAVEAINEIGDITNDRLKRQAILEEMFDKLKD